MITTKNVEYERVLAMLRYQAEHYRQAGKGAISQQINARIRRLEEEINLNAVKY